VLLGGIRHRVAEVDKPKGEPTPEVMGIL
jgi:hypothetical protein